MANDAAAAASSPNGGGVRFDGVSKIYRPRGGGEIGALRDVSFEVAPGEIFGVIGRSGAGKSSLIRLVNGLERPNAGVVSVDGVDVGALSPRRLPDFRRRIGMIFQSFNLLNSKTVEDNVALPMVFAGQSWKDARAHAAGWLGLVGLDAKRSAYPARLSGGQKQRVGIARALALHPRVLLSDEATSALDPETTRSILALLKDINRRLGVTIILITHEMEVIRQVADRVAVLEAGRIVEQGPVWRVFGSPTHEATKAILEPQDRLAATQLTAEPGRVLIELDFTGAEGTDPDLFVITQALGPDSRLVFGSVDRIQGRAAGRLVFSAPAPSDGERENLIARLASIAPRVEFI